METFHHVARHYPENMIGSFIYIYWKEDDVWYRAKVIKYLEVTKKFKVLYDDKNEEKIDLASEWFLVEDERLRESAAQRKKDNKIEFQQ